MILSDDFALSAVFCMCLLYVSFGSKVSPSILGFLTVGRVVLSISSVSAWLYSAGSGVNSVVVVLDAFSCSEFCIVHWWIWFRYG